MKYKINAIIIILGLFFFNSCNDDQIISEPDKMEVDNGLKSFDSYDELFDELETVNNMSIEELADYEDTQDFNSFGKISDQLYYAFTADTTHSELDILDFINLNPKYVELVIESDTSFVPTFDNVELRYIMNDDRMFKVQDTLFKVFKTGIVSTLFANYDDLYHLEDKDLDDLDTSIFIFNRYCIAKLSNPEYRAAIVNKERIDFWLYYRVLNTGINSNNQIVELYMTGTLIRPKHKFVFWNNASRTISSNYTFTIAYNAVNYTNFSDYSIGTSPTFKRSVIHDVGEQVVSQSYNSFFSSLGGSVRQPNVILYF